MTLELRKKQINAASLLIFIKSQLSSERVANSIGFVTAPKTRNDHKGPQAAEAPRIGELLAALF